MTTIQPWFKTPKIQFHLRNNINDAKFTTPQEVDQSFNESQQQQPSAVGQSQCEQQLADKTKEFDGLMEFTLKQNTQIKTLTSNLAQKEKESENYKRTIQELEKSAIAAASGPNNVSNPATPVETTTNGAPLWALLVAFILGMLVHSLLLCSKCAVPK
jgi:ADP-ribosylglycohydrolase